MEIVRFLDDADVVFDAENPPQFDCALCGGETYPEEYRNAFGYEFKISDVR